MSGHPARVYEIQVTVEALAERTFVGVPVVIASGVWQSIPATVQLHVTGPAALVRSLTRDRFIVTADSSTSEGQRVSVQVVPPEGVTATVSPDSVQARRVIL